VTGAVIPPISLSTTFKQNAPGEPKAGYDYSRSGNPTRDGFEKAVAALEQGKHGALVGPRGGVYTHGW
jgi:cystathionine gamma-lyase